MSDPNACPLSHSDAAYVLGALSPAERLEFERHLPTCAACRRSVAQLAGMPGLLARVPVEQVEQPLPEEPMPPTVLPALVSAVRREQRRRTVLISLGAAAAVAVVAFGVNALQQSGDDSRSREAVPASTSATPAQMRAMDVVINWGVTAEVSLAPAEGGTAVDFTCTYADRPEGGGHPYHYVLVAYTRDGNRHQLMDWSAKPGKTWGDEQIEPIDLAKVARLEVQNDEGVTILKLNV